MVSHRHRPVVPTGDHCGQTRGGAVAARRQDSGHAALQQSTDKGGQTLNSGHAALQQPADEGGEPCVRRLHVVTEPLAHPLDDVGQ